GRSKPISPWATGALLGVGSRWGRWFTVRLSGSGSRCQGHLEVNYKDKWYTVHSQSWGLRPFHREDPGQAWKLCQELQCREPLLLSHFRHFKGKRPQSQITCRGQLGSFSNCSDSKANQGDPLALICLEPLRTTPLPTSPPPITTPEPTAPPRLQLVARPGGLRCAGLVEFYSGSLGGTVGIESQDGIQDLGNLICAALQCGSFLRPLPETEAARKLEPGESGPLPIRWRIQNRRCATLEQCFRKVQPQAGGQALGLICSDFQPKVQSRLVGGSGTCEGSVEVRQGKQWDALCDSSSGKGMARWEDVCREQQCGNVSSYQLLDTGEKTSRGFFCPPGKLSQCHQLLQKKSHCKRVFVTCQNTRPAGLGAGTVASVILALVLAVMLLVVCGPLAYKKLVKKCRCRCPEPPPFQAPAVFPSQPHGDCPVPAENPTASHLENEYSQPPRNLPNLTLEGALHRVSTQPDNSSDSDYDLHGAQRL
uniref:T-cell surface glycoprotein CD5 n=1 Tax=Phocoena sinus TaxID=42100 RepID=A0A8C9BZD2_PHOSS